MIFETERLIVRELIPNDLKHFHTMHSNVNVMKFTGDTVKSYQEDEEDIARLISNYRKVDNDFWVWAVVLKKNNQFIGTCALIGNDERQFDPTKYEIGYRLDEPYWNNGFASEITPALINFAFEKFGKTELMAEVDELNKASVKVIEKNMIYLKTQFNPKFKSNDRIYIIRKKMKDQALNSAPAYYHHYIQLVDDKPFEKTLLTNGISIYEEHFEQLESLGNNVYETGKWTVKEIVQHCMDTERIFINRALRFARLDDTELPGYDHDAYVPISRANDKTLSDLLEEYRVVRHASYLFFKGLNSEELERTGIANGKRISVLAIGFILQGHPLHHFNIIRERYFTL
ncbi:GNAT family N-acetyltransferase [Crocinitomix algicola]|uniref:GNAT family N-acetyltransferase n=1 Tax=Crocinitomix algicola TaxID=1740263 RepID=UPI0009F60193|nr:GNAT family N-acetyltransferase [Crocinitomix algicola]